MGKVKKKLAPFQKIQTINYQAWQVPGFQIYKALRFTIIDILQKRLKIGIIELCYSPY